MEINLNECYSDWLTSVWLADDLFDKINNSSDDDIILNFEGVKFIALSFTQAYINFKRHSAKNIREVNLNDENNTMLSVVAGKYNVKIG